MLIFLKGICLANEILAWRTEIDINLQSMLIHRITFSSHIKCVRWQCQWRVGGNQIVVTIFLFCLPDLFLPTRCRQTGLLLHLIILNDTHTHSLGRNPLDKGSARHSNLYLKTHNAHKRRTSTPPVGIEPAIPASERPQTHGLDRVASGIGVCDHSELYFLPCHKQTRN